MTLTKRLEPVEESGIPLQSEPGMTDEETPQDYKTLREIYPYDWFALRKGSGVVINHNRRPRLLHKYLHDKKISRADIREPMKHKN